MSPHPAASELIGQVLQDRYQIEKQLGQKTGRRTFLAIDLNTERKVVIKLLIFNQEFIWDDLKLFEREAETLKHLHHSAIPHYLDYFEFDLPTLKGFALVQTHIDAPSLAEAFSAGRRFTEAELRELARSLLDILAYLHELQPPVIHRDLKPSNILLTNRSGNSIGDVYLVDFGSVQNVTARDGGTMTVVGTYGYMPLEQFGGKAVPASDLYSLGATLIYLMTGVHPADLPAEDGKIQVPRKFSQGWQNWLGTMTEPSLKRRFPDVQTAIAALERSESTTSITADRPYGSQISLKKSAHKLEITAPDPRFPISWGLAIVLSLFILPIPAQIIIGMLSPLMPVFTYVFFGFAVRVLSWSPIIYNWIYRYRGQVNIHIDRDLIRVTNVLGQIELNFLPPSHRSSIHSLTYYPQPSTYPQGKMLPPAQIAIAAGVREYRILSYSPVECEWLLKELSEWLDLPVKTINNF
jgi:serine/threonine protein kinase